MMPAARPIVHKQVVIEKKVTKRKGQKEEKETSDQKQSH